MLLTISNIFVGLHDNFSHFIDDRMIFFLPSLVVCSVEMQYDESLPITKYSIIQNAKKHV